MRAALAVLMVVAGANAAVAQKTPPPGHPAPAPGATAQTTLATGLADTCLRFARGDTDAVDRAIAEGWAVDDYAGGDSFIDRLAASRNLPGVGDVNLFGTVETYPEAGLRSCQINVITEANAADVGIDALSGWQGMEGSVNRTQTGVYGTWQKVDDDAEQLHLLTAQQDSSIIIQLTIVSARAAR